MQYYGNAARDRQTDRQTDTQMPVTDIHRQIWQYVVIATKPMHRLQICPTVHTYRAPPTIPPSYIRVHAVVWECGERQTDRCTSPIYILYRPRVTRNVMTLGQMVPHRFSSFTCTGREPLRLSDADLSAGRPSILSPNQQCQSPAGNSQH